MISFNWTRNGVGLVEEPDRLSIEVHCRDTNDQEAADSIVAAAPPLYAALAALLPEVDAEIEQRQTSGLVEYWQGLKKLSDAGHAALARADGNPLAEALHRGRQLGDLLSVGRITLSREDTDHYRRTGRLRGTTARFATASHIVDADGRVLKSPDSDDIQT